MHEGSEQLFMFVGACRDSSFFIKGTQVILEFIYSLPTMVLKPLTHFFARKYEIYIYIYIYVYINHDTYIDIYIYAMICYVYIYVYMYRIDVCHSCIDVCIDV